jgi:Zn-dependent protease with chaperone function
MDTPKWNSLYNPSEVSESPVGKTGWLTIIGVALSLFAGAIVLMSTIAFSFERYFEFKADQPVTATSAHVPKKFVG